MPDSNHRRSPLDAHGGSTAPVEGARVSLRVCEPRGQLVVRGAAASTAFVDGVRAVTGLAPPSSPLASAGAGEFDCLWMGPDEWLLVMPEGRQADVMAALHRQLADEHHAVADVSSSRMVISLAGEAAREVLMKGCSLDLHARAFVAGRVDQSSLARCHVMLHLLDDTPRFEVYVHRSFAGYCWRWMVDAAREYTLPAAPA